MKLKFDFCGVVFSSLLSMFIISATSAQYAYVTNDSSISVINTLTNTVEHTVPVNRDTYNDIDLTPDGRFAYLAGFWSHQVVVFSTITNSVVTTIPIPWGAPHGIAITPDGNTAYVTCFWSEVMGVIDIKTNTIVDHITLPGWGNLYGIALTADASTAYVARRYSASVSVVNLSTKTVIADIPVGNEPLEVALSPDGNFAYVTNSWSDNVSVINTSLNTVVATIPVGHHPHSVSFTPDGSHAYVSNQYGSSVSVINTSIQSVSAVIAVENGPVDIEFIGDGLYAYVANEQSSSVSVINTNLNTVILRIPVGYNPTFLAISVSTTNKIKLNAMNGMITGDARLGSVWNSINSKAVYFQGLNGGVSFNVDIPQSSKKWYVWGRMYYMSGGGKTSFQLTFDNIKYILGDNDNKYNQWHWDGNDGARINLGVLTPGQHKLVISGREPGLTLWIDQLIITDDPGFVPSGFTSTTSKITLNAMQGTFTGDARLGTMTGSINTRAVYFQGLNGGVSFNIDIPSSKRHWSAWGRMYYMSSGSRNSFYVTAAGEKHILGDNDNKYNQWHWDGNNGGRIDLGILSPGEHTIMISGREPGLTLWIDQLIFTDDPDYIPEGFSYSTNKIFVNAMNGTFTGDARLGTMTGSLNTRCVYFQGLTGGISFNVNLPSSQKDWYIWGRMYYMSSGGKNSFYVSTDGIKYVLGDNDSKYNQWQWDGNNGARINIGTLAAGNHTIMISGREPGLTLWVDQLLLTDDENFNPSDALIKSSSNADSTEIALQKQIPSDYELSQNYPNPFNPTTTIRYGMPSGGSAELNIYDITGQLVSALYSGEVEDGYHELTWNSTNNNGVNVHSGMYFCRLTARSSKGEYSKVIKMILVK